MLGLECESRGNRSDRRERAREEVMMCGKVMRGRDIVGGKGEEISYGPLIAARIPP